MSRWLTTFTPSSNKLSDSMSYIAIGDLVTHVYHPKWRLRVVSQRQAKVYAHPIVTLHPNVGYVWERLLTCCPIPDQEHDFPIGWEIEAPVTEFLAVPVKSEKESESICQQ